MKSLLIGGLLLACGAAPVSAQSPEGRKWVVAQIGSERVTGEAQAKTRLVLEGGRVSASVGCNGIGGTYRLNGSSITIEGLIMTRMFCAGLDKRERALTQGLRDASSWGLRQGALELADRQGRVLVSFVQARQ